MDKGEETMADTTDQKPFAKGDLAEGFNSTSVGTTLRDEKNIAMDALDGNSSHIPRKDHYANSSFKSSVRKRKEDKKRSFWQYLLFMINQMQRSIEADFTEISAILDDIRLVCETTLETIEALSKQIDMIRLDHELVMDMLDQSEEQTLNTQNQHIIAISDRYQERTGQSIPKDADLKNILLQQIVFEQSNTLPQLEYKRTIACNLYEDSMSAVENIEDQKRELTKLSQELNDSPESQNNLNELEKLKKMTSELKTQSEEIADNIDARLNRIVNNDIEEFGAVHIKDQEIVRNVSLNIQSIGIKNTIPIP